ncbi:uncharacterized protein Dwil_GK17325 [Drosophila willistoni]|uniref:SKP1 component POZ domain-containing protein n=1 Tax=Drosophila willistoni TaxID=7260 RepID=B4MM20_DROWI|nr:S-phase kinase-associated protein 1 [Drosophila willistoni]EDW73029.1 uncharacterized protein Dwil_GK17325 [Drosophila willistoni]
MQQLKLKTLDGKSVEANLEIVNMSSVIQNLLLDCKMENGAAVITLQNIHSWTLDTILIWATHHKDDDPEDYEDEKFVNDPWDVEFLQEHDDMIFYLINAAEDLNMQNLYIACVISFFDMAAMELEHGDEDDCDDVDEYDDYEEDYDY